jgi:hypothetical protein
MGNVLIESTAVTCAATATAPAPHGGTVTGVTAARLRVDGGQVLVGVGLPWSIAPGTCGNTGPGQKKCTQVVSVTGTASKLRVDGHPVVLDGVGGVTDGAPAGTIKPTAGIPGRLRAV